MFNVISLVFLDPPMLSTMDNADVKHVDGSRLVLHQVQRTDMGGYMCM